MTLGFKQYFPWHTEKNPAPTNFREKIIERLHENQPNPIVWTPKIHTMRADPTNRWKAGRKIEMVYRGAGYKIIDHFNKGIPELGACTGVQSIHIKHYDDGQVHISIDNKIFFWGSLVHEKFATKEEYLVNINSLVKNDGFNSIEDFFRWFNKDWSGKLIHWTDFRY